MRYQVVLEVMKLKIIISQRLLTQTLIIKTNTIPGQIIGVDEDGNDIVVNSDKLRKTYLGVSNTVGFDPSFFEFSGEYEGVELVKGFHMSSQASGTEFIKTQDNFETSQGNFEKLDDEIKVQVKAI